MKNIPMFLLFISLAAVALAGTTHKRFHKRQLIYDGANACCEICTDTCRPGCTIDYISNSSSPPGYDPCPYNFTSTEGIPVDIFQPLCCECKCNDEPPPTGTSPKPTNSPLPENESQEVHKKCH